jgi:hypothetical protein
MKTKLIVLAVVAAGSMFAGPRFSVGIGVGGYAPRYYQPAPAYVVEQPPCPGPGYSWVAGYYGGNSWTPGYWAPPVRYDNRAYAYSSSGHGHTDQYARRGYDRDYDRGDRGRYGGRDNDHDRGREGYRGR